MVKVYYSISNGGDGSAYLRLFVSEKAAGQHQELENIDEGWAEDCSGSIEIKGENISVPAAKTDEAWIKEMEERLDYASEREKKLIAKFIKELKKKPKKTK